MLPRTLAIRLLCLLILTLATGFVHQAIAQRVLTVNSTADASDAAVDGGVCETSVPGECTFRAAIEEANFDAAVDTIRFDIPPATDPGCDSGTGVCTIAPAAQLPGFSETIVVDGTTQSSATCGVNFVGRDLRIVVDGASQASGGGLVISGANSLVKGLVISNFASHGVIADAGGSKMQCNIIGADPTGTIARGNNSQGIWLFPSNSFTVGTDGDGIDDEAEGNLISGNNGNGIRVEGGGGHRIAGNFIGVQMDGVTPLPNTNFGIFHFKSSNSVTGGDEVTEWNTIAHNGNTGVGISNQAGTGNRVQLNRIFSNGGLGIDILTDGVTANDSGDADTGPNNLQNTPVLLSAVSDGQSLLFGFFVDSDPANSAFPIQVDLYIADGDNEEGKQWVHSVAYTATDWSSCGSAPCSIVLPLSLEPHAIGDMVVATATDENGNTSEFSAPITIMPVPPIVVNSTSDSGDNLTGDGLCWTGGLNSEGQHACTLRAAIEEANTFAGTDTISFDIPTATDTGCDNGTGICTIQTSSALPDITQRLVLDAETQPGATCGTSFATRDLRIALDGTNAGAVSGLNVTNGANGSLVRGLAIHSFEIDGIIATQTNSVQIVCNYIGTDATGMIDLGNGRHGIITAIVASNLVIGTDGDGTDDAREGNLISGNASNGINLYRANNSTIAGNYIGWNANGSATIGNDGTGIFFFQGSNDRVGTDGDGISDNLEANVIVGNAHGVGFARTFGHTVAGNFIGTDPTGLQDFGNTGIGIGDFNTPGINNNVFGTNLDGNGDDAEGNTIAFNGSAGVSLPKVDAFNNAVRGNAMYANGGLGIDLQTFGVTANDAGDADAGSNNLQNFPELITVELDGDSVRVVYRVDSDTANAEYPLRVEFFEADADNEEGAVFAGVDTLLATDWHGCGSPPCLKAASFFNSGGALAQGDYLVATATDSLGNTSEFSAPLEVDVTFVGASVHVKAFLQGPYIGPAMSTALRDGGHLPLSQPFSNVIYDGTVLDYDSVQTVDALPDSTVDWVLVNLRTTTDSASTVATATHAALLYENGTIASPNENSLRFADLADGSYYLVVRSRNHLDIMSDTALVVSGGVGVHDFTTAVDRAFGTNAQTDVGAGVWAILAGDSNADGNVQALDFNSLLAQGLAGATGYQTADFDLGGNIDESDLVLYFTNTATGASSQVPGAP